MKPNRSGVKLPSIKPRVGVSACLFGAAVRPDATDRRFAFVTRTLARRFELVPVCPEVEMGLGVPRETIQLEGDPAKPLLRGNDSGRDLTSAMQRWAARRVRELEALGLSGYVFKRNSPSCGPARVKVWPVPAPARGKGRPKREGIGLFAKAVLDAWPQLPIEDEASLMRPGRQARFLARVEAYHRWRSFEASAPTPEALRAFHLAERPLRRRLGGRSERALSELIDRFRSRGGRRFLLEYGEVHLDACLGGRAAIDG